MRKLSVAAWAWCSHRVAACGGGDDDQTADNAAASGKLEGSISVWIMDPGSPKIQGVVKQYGKDFEAQNPGHEGRHPVRAVGAGPRQVRDRDRGRQTPDVAEIGTTWTPEFADQARSPSSPSSREWRVRLQPPRRRHAQRQVLRPALVRGRPRPGLPQDLLEQPGIAPPNDLGRAEGRRQDDQGQGGGEIDPVGATGLSEHMFLPPSGRPAVRSPPMTASRGCPRSTPPRPPRVSDSTGRSTRRASAPRRRSPGKSPTRRPRSSPATSRS